MKNLLPALGMACTVLVFTSCEHNSEVELVDSVTSFEDVAPDSQDGAKAIRLAMNYLSEKFPEKVVGDVRAVHRKENGTYLVSFASKSDYLWSSWPIVEVDPTLSYVVKMIGSA